MLAEHLRNHQDPFELTPDPKFCYLDPARRQASARLLSGLYAGDGLFMLTGRSGIGKSILLHHLAEQLTGLEVVYPLTDMQVFACRTGTTLNDVLAACESRLRLGASGATPLKAAKQLQQFVDNARSPALLLDDADLLADDTLEAMYTLSALQASDRSLLSVVLAGHPSMVARLSAIGGVSIGQRHPVINLEPMTEADAARLIRYRLRAAERSEDAFGADAIEKVIRHAAGIPFNIVRICGRALEMGDRRSLKSVTADLIAEVISEDIPAVPRESARAVSAAGAKPDHIAPSRSPRQPAVAAALPPNASAHVGPAAFAPPSTQPPDEQEKAPPSIELRLLESSPARSDDAPLPRAEKAPQMRAHDSSWPPQGGRTAPEPSLVREAHMYIPDVTLGRPSRTGSTQRNARDHGALRRRSRRGRTKLTLAGGGLFLVLLAAGLLTFMGGIRQLGDSSRPPATAELAPAPAHESEGQSAIPGEEAWWKPTGPSDPLVSGVPAPSNWEGTETKEQNPLEGLASVDVGRVPEVPINEPAVNPDRKSDQGAGEASPASNAPGASAQPETASHPAAPPPDVGKEPQVAPPPTPHKGEPHSPPPASAQAKAEPQPKAPAPAASIAGPPAKPRTAQPKLTPARSREIETLLAEGDARLAEGDLDGARSAYEHAYDRGSRAAALRMAQTFDPRNVGEATKTASPAEAILWYQDAARKGDRGARQELENLATWLENDAAAGNHEAQRVLDVWRQPAEPEEDGY